MNKIPRETDSGGGNMEAEVHQRVSEEDGGTRMQRAQGARQMSRERA